MKNLLRTVFFLLCVAQAHGATLTYNNWKASFNAEVANGPSAATVKTWIQSHWPTPDPTPTPTPTSTPTPSPTATPVPTPTPSTKFKVGNSVQPSPNVANVRATPGGTLLGTQPLSAVGVVNAGPGFGTYDPSVPSFWWWNVTFPNGASGWIGEDDLISAPNSTPTPTPSATPSPTPSATPIVSGKVWNTNGSSAAVQSAINSAAPGDTVTVPAGTFSGWNVSISTPIILKGAGQGSTIIKANGENAVVSVNATSSAARITGFTFDGGTDQVIMIQFAGNTAELMDHCTLIGGDASEMIHNIGMGPSDASGWNDDITPGSANAVYIENCTFTKNPIPDQYFWGTSAIESYYGARTVIRFCTFNYCQIDQHGTQGMIGARWWEFYNNTFTVPANGNQSNFFALRGGSGVVFNNVVSGGPNEGGGSLELYSDDTQSTPPYGPGVGINGKMSPAYVWANSSAMQVTSGSSNVSSGRNFMASATKPATMNICETAAQAKAGGGTYSYQPYVYPHPLDQ